MHCYAPYGPKQWIPATEIENKAVRRHGICFAKNCRKQPYESQKYCQMHKARLWKLRNPARYSFGKLRFSAKRRGKDFTLTFAEWLVFWEENNLAEYRGRQGCCLQVDRIDPHRGYSLGNIQAITCSENTAKGNRERACMAA